MEEEKREQETRKGKKDRRTRHKKEEEMGEVGGKREDDVFGAWLRSSELSWALSEFKNIFTLFTNTCRC